MNKPLPEKAAPALAKQTAKGEASAQPLATHNVFLDTQVYRSCHHDPRSPVLAELAKKVRAGELRLHITDITYAEIKRQIGEMSREVVKELKEPRIKFNAWHRRHPELVKAELPEFDHKAIADAAFKQFLERARSYWKATEHAASRTSAYEVFKDYFAGKAPFEARESREFPDAFVIRTLEQWCIDHSETMYVVGKDKAMGDAAAASPHLHRIATLTEFMESAAASDTQELSVQANDLLYDPAIQAALEKEIKKQVPDLIPIYSGDQLYDGEVSDHEYAGSIEVDDFKVIAASPAEVALVLYVKVALFVDVDYEDRTYASYDNEEGIYVGGEAATRKLEPIPKIRVFARIKTGKPGKPALRDVEIITQEVNVPDDPEPW